MNYSLIALIVIVVILSAWMMHGSATSEGLNSIASTGDADGCVNGVCSVSPKKKKIKTD
jgi:hypothetical protein